MAVLQSIRELMQEVFLPDIGEPIFRPTRQRPQKRTQTKKLLDDYMSLLRRYLAEGGKIDAFYPHPLPEKEIDAFLSGGKSPWESLRPPLYADVLVAMSEEGWEPLPEFFVPAARRRCRTS